jgi:trehalose 6-phosphate phosphatase
MHGLTDRPPLPSPDASWALFIDVDGTLTEFAAHPDLVVVSPGLIDSLRSIDRELDGALAIVSGRPVAQIDALFAPLRLACGGLHGLERRRSATAPVECVPVPFWHGEVRAALDAFADAHPGAWVEDKDITLALHYRTAPAAAADAQALADAIGARRISGLDILRGKMIVEFRPDSAHKGTVISDFMELAPFAGRTPVFLGDDVTDEDGFLAVKARKGIAIRVGDGSETAADWRLETVSDSHAWLAEVARRVAQRRKE